MIGTATNNFMALVFNYVKNNVDCYASLHYTSPNLDDPTASEVVSTSKNYVRKKISWSQSDAHVLHNANELSWSALNNTSVQFIGVFDSAFGNNLLFKIPLTTPYVITSGSYKLPAGSLYIAMT